MGIRSDVALAVKSHVAKVLREDDEIEEVLSVADEKLTHNGDTLYVWEDIKWYVEEDHNLSLLYEVLRKCDPNDYLVICATPECPESNDLDEGEWRDNPWNVWKQCTVVLNFSRIEDL